MVKNLMLFNTILHHCQGPGEWDSFPSGKKGCPFSCQRKAWWAKDLSSTVFHCPEIVEHFACKSHSLCTLLLLILVLLLGYCLLYHCISASSKLFLSQSMIAPFLVPHRTWGRECFEVFFLVEVLN